MTGQVIVVDDEAAIREAVQQWLELSGFRVHSCATAQAALALVDRDYPGIIISDVRMPGTDGLQLLDKLLELDRDLPVILVTGHGDVPMAVQALRQGAYDFIEKPFTPERLLDSVRRALDKRRLVCENRQLREQFSRKDQIEAQLLGVSKPMENLRRQILELAGTSVNILLRGDTGSGKERVARCLHDFSNRAGKPFVALNCAAIPEHLFESELFGHESGAFTGAQGKRIGRIEHADGGTLFLDEVGDIPLAMQVKLLRLIESGQGSLTLGVGRLELDTQARRQIGFAEVLEHAVGQVEQVDLLRRTDGEVVQIHHRGRVRDRIDQAVERRGGVLRPRIGDEIAARSTVLASQDETAGGVQGQAVLETVAALEMIREADGGNHGDGVQIGRRHRPPGQAILLQRGQRVLSGAAVKFHSMLRACPLISPSIRALRASSSRS